MLQDMIRAPTAKPMEVLLRQASPDTYKDVLKEVKAKEFYNLVIDTKPENMNFFLKGVSVVQRSYLQVLCGLEILGVFWNANERKNLEAQNKRGVIPAFLTTDP
jgi:hypothetical protein